MLTGVEVHLKKLLVSLSLQSWCTCHLLKCFINKEIGMSISVCGIDYLHIYVGKCICVV